MPVRTMPSALEAEASLLGTLMVYPNAARTAMEEGLAEEDFYADANRRIFHAVHTLYQEGSVVDLTTVSTRLMDTGQLDTVGGFDYLTRLTDASVTSANTKNYVELIHDKAVMRRMIETAQKIAEDGFEGQTDLDEYLDEAEREILRISRNRRTTEFKNAAEVFGGVVNRIQMLSKNSSSITGLKTGFHELDRLTHGFQKGDLIILAARPSMGKTAVALNLALQAAEHNRNAGAIAIFSLEMPSEQLGLRLLSAKSRILSDKLKTGQNLTNQEWNAINEAATDLKGLKIFMDDSSIIKTSEIFSKCHRLKAEHGLSLVLIDYIQLITGSSSGRDVSRQQEVSDISRNLKALARELEVPVIALSQLSRSVESRENKRPMLSDLRESGAIEQDADMVMMLYREAYYNEEAKKAAQENNSEKIEVIVAKHRNGETRTFELAFEASTNTCMNIAYTGAQEN